MSPFNEYRKAFIAACLTVAAINAFVTGIGLPVIVRFVDGFSYGILLFLTGSVLCNIFRFAVPENYSQKYRSIFIIALLFTSSALTIGIETLTVYLCFPATFELLIPSIPVRSFIVFLLYTLLFMNCRFLYENIEDIADYPEIVSEKNPIDSHQADNLDKSDTTGTANNAHVQIVDRLTVRYGQKIKIIPIEDILYIKADGDYISIRTTEGSWLKEQTMKYTENRLPVNSFTRIHRSFIVNIHRISRIERYGEKQQVVLSNNEKIKISAARFQTLKQILGI